MNLVTKQTHRLREQTLVTKEGRAGETDKLEIWIDVYILLYLKCIINKDLLYDRELCSIFCNNPNGKRTLKIMDIYIYN